VNAESTITARQPDVDIAEMPGEPAAETLGAGAIGMQLEEMFIKAAREGFVRASLQSANAERFRNITDRACSSGICRGHCA
jgi:hypothetical protein